MGLLKHWSIKSKLIILSTISSILALGLACTGFVIHDFSSMRNSKIRELKSTTDMLGYNSAVGLMSQDKPACDAFLETLTHQPAIERVCLYGPDGMTVAAYPQAAFHEFSTPWTEPTEMQRYTRDGDLEVFHPIYQSGHYVGGVFLRANTDDVTQQFHANLKITGLVMLACLFVSFLFSCWMQRGLSAPILNLAETASRIERDSDYSIRVEASTQDEIAQLYESFNGMVEKVQLSKAKLEQANAGLAEAHASLERRVFERTRELHEEVQNRARIQVELEHAKNAAEAANRAKTEFLANISHEIRTPLNAILGFANVLRDGTETESERLDCLNTIQNGGEHLITLINDVLDLSKIEAGQMEYRRVPASPHQIISEIISVSRVKAQEKALSLEYSWVGAVPESISTDPVRLRQLLFNTVGNAIKFTETGGVRVVAQLNVAAEQMVIDVIDSGIGIHSGKLAAIFDPFTQADSSVTRRFGGTGLGLSISRHIARALGGDITVRSEPGRGSMFSLSVPTGPLDGIPLLQVADGDLLDGMRDQLPRRRLQLPAVKILVVDDGETNRKLLKLVLSRAGVTIETAENGRQAIDLALSRDYALIIMDMQMPVLDGYSATRHLRAAGLSIPIVALTAHAMREDEQKCLEAGCSSYLSKPFESERLIELLASALDRNRQTVDTMPNEPANLAPPLLRSTLPLDDSEFFEIVQEFTERLKLRLGEMWDAFSKKDLTRLGNLVHWLKGTGGTAGFTPLSESAAAVELAIKNLNWPTIKQSLSDLTALANRIHIPEAYVPI